MELIQKPLAEPDINLPVVELTVSRFKLQKRRWRAEATDGTDFGFDLEEPLTHGAVFFQTTAARYVIAQEPELVLETSLGDDAAAGARAGWSVGNLHLPMQVDGEIIRVADDPAIRQLFEQSGVPYHEAKSIFAPMRVSTGSGDHNHSHSHSHSHDNGHSHG